MAFKRCSACVGSGKVLGGGMITKDCDNCDGRGKILIDEKYEASLDRIQNGTDLSRDDAKKMLDEEVVKVKKKEKTKNNSSINLQ